MQNRQTEAEIDRQIAQGSSEPAVDHKEKRVGVMLRLSQETVLQIDDALSRLPVRPTRHAWLLQAIEEKLERDSDRDRAFVHMIVWLTELDIRPQSRDNKAKNHDDSGEPIKMYNASGLFRRVRQLASMLLSLIIDAVCYLGLCLCPSPALAAENLFLRKQLALYEERQVKPARATNAIRLAMMWLSYCFDWRSALRIVKPETFIAWHRKGFRWFWRYKSKPG